MNVSLGPRRRNAGFFRFYAGEFSAIDGRDEDLDVAVPGVSPGMSRGNWRVLRVLHRMPIDFQDLRWTEWLIHRRLWSRHVSGEWFRVRDLLLGDDWQRFLLDVLEARMQAPNEWHLSIPGHEPLRCSA